MSPTWRLYVKVASIPSVGERFVDYALLRIEGKDPPRAKALMTFLVRAARLHRSVSKGLTFAKHRRDLFETSAD